MTTPMILLIVAACIFGLASFLYGIFRKFTQMSWMAWQVLLLFAVTLLLDYVPAEAGAWAKFLIGIIVLLGGGILVLGGGAAIRTAMHKKYRPAHPVWHFLDRLLGGITAFVDYAAIVLVLASLALPVLYYLVDLPALDFLFGAAAWKDYWAMHLFDLWIVALFLFAMRGGWRVGLGRTVLIFVMFGLTIGALALSAYLVLAVPSFSNAASNLVAAFNFDPGVAKIVGSGLLILILFVLLFVLVCIVGFFMTKLVRHIRFTGFWGFLDGLLGMLLSLAVAAGVFIGVYFAVAYLADGTVFDQLQNALAQIGGEEMQGVTDAVKNIIDVVKEWVGRIDVLFSSSPLSRFTYQLFR